MQKQTKIEKRAVETKIGLEIHGYLDTKEKLFCKCSTSSDEANSSICPICTGQPGSKPMMPNSEAMDKLLKISLVLGCKINHDKKLVWQRKHYSWPDLPKGFQSTISGAYSVPCAENGKFFGVRIRETHLEEDPARWNPETGGIDYNRSGLPLIEIVTEPDFFDSSQVADWLKKLIHSISYIKTIRKDLGIKVDVNVSTYGERVEIKNLHSIESIQKAIDYEIKRQLENYEKDIEQKRETLAYDEHKGITIKMREKESGEDYRFITEPDLPVVILDEKIIKKIEREIPEMPEEKLKKLLGKYKIEKYDASVLIKNLELVDFFEELAKHVDAKKYISWVTIELLRILNYNHRSLEDEDIEIKPEHLAELIEAVDKKQLTELKAKQIMNDFIPKSFSVREKGLIESAGKISDMKEIEGFCRQVIKNHPQAVSDFEHGEKEAFNFLMGEVMKVSQRRADFGVVRECLAGMIG